jgi:16S rRNA (cytosine967-C5)-methyltransferase
LSDNEIGGTRERNGRARSYAVRALARVFDEGAYANLAIASFQKKDLMDSREAALFYELVAGTTRRINTIDHVVNSFLKNGNLAKLPAIVRDSLRIGAYQLLFLDGIEPSCAVDASVEIVKAGRYKGFSGMVNGVLRKIARSEDSKTLDFSAYDHVEMLALKYSFPEWLVAKWLQRYSPEEVAQICEHFNSRHELYAYCNNLKQDIVALLAALEAEGWSCRGVSNYGGAVNLGKNFKPEKSPTFTNGGLHIVDLPSIIVAKAVRAVPGDKVIDLCAAPGGKTFCMATDMEGVGSICACDVDSVRLGLIRGNMERLGYSNQFIQLFKHDATVASSESWVNYFDKVLVDAPCSGTGVMGRKADARWRKSPKDITVLAELQLEIILRAAKLVKKGGTMVYSTCSMEREEGEDVINKFLSLNPDFIISSFDANDGVLENYQEANGFIRTLPHKHGLDGFFVARLRRVGG